MAYDLAAEDRHRADIERPTPFSHRPTFRPVVVRERHDGWTCERQAHFIEMLGECGCVTEACAAVGMSTASAYRLKNRHDAIDFRLAWDAALDVAVGRVEDGVLGRAINGVAVPHYYQGEQIGEHRRYDERLALFMLRYRKPLYYGRHRDRQHLVGGHPEDAAERFAVGVRMVLGDVSRGLIEDEDAEAAAAHLARDLDRAADARRAATRAADLADAAAARAATGDAKDAQIAAEARGLAAERTRDAVAADARVAAMREWVAHAQGVLAKRAAAETNHTGGDVPPPSQTSATSDEPDGFEVKCAGGVAGLRQGSGRAGWSAGRQGVGGAAARTDGAAAGVAPSRPAAGPAGVAPPRPAAGPAGRAEQRQAAGGAPGGGSPARTPGGGAATRAPGAKARRRRRR